MKRLIRKSQTEIYLKDIVDPITINFESGPQLQYTIDEKNRDFAIVVIDGKVYTGPTHEQAVHSNTNFNYNEVENMKSAYAHYVTGKDGNKYIILYPFVDNMTITEAAQILKEHYPNEIICVEEDMWEGEDSYITQVAKKIIKKANKINLKDILKPEDIEFYGLNTDYGNRDFAIAYINGELLEGQVHKDLVEEYINNYGMDEDIIDHGEGYVTEEELDDLDLPCGFASYIKGIDGNDYIAIYPGTMYGYDMYDFKDELSKKYPNAIICADDNDRYEYYDENSDIYIETI